MALPDLSVGEDVTIWHPDGSLHGTLTYVEPVLFTEANPPSRNCPYEFWHVQLKVADPSALFGSTVVTVLCVHPNRIKRHPGNE